MEHNDDTHGSDRTSAYQKVYYVAILAAIAVCIGFGVGSWMNNTPYPIAFAIAIGFIVAITIGGVELIVKADSGGGHFGGVRMGIGLIICCCAFTVLVCMAPGNWLNEVRKVVNPFQNHAGRKPTISEIGAPQPQPPLRWMKIECADGQTIKDVFVQVRMTQEQAKNGFAVLAAVQLHDDAIVGWGKSSKGENTKTNDY